MNETVDVFSISTLCEICQTSYGFTSADRRSIIVLVVLVGIALVLCYASVLWYAIRTRLIPDDKLPIIPEITYTNEVFNENEGPDEDIEANVQNTVNMATTQPVVFTVEDERERY